MREAYERAASLGEIAPEFPLAVTLSGGDRICLVREERAATSRVYAVADRCTHKDFALSGGELVEPCVLECPWHGARYDVRTGAVISGPATDPVMTYPVRVVGDDVYVAPRQPR